MNERRRFTDGNVERYLAEILLEGARSLGDRPRVQVLEKALGWDRDGGYGRGNATAERLEDFFGGFKMKKGGGKRELGVRAGRGKRGR